MINEIINGDCIDIMSSLEDNFCEMTLTDIPYNEVNRKSNGLRDFDKGAADQLNFDLEKFLQYVVRITKGSIYVFCGTEQVSFVRAFFVDNNLSTRLCIWQKNNPSPINGQHLWLSGIECCVYGKKKNGIFNEFCKNTVWKYPASRNKFHKTEKPLKLFEYLVSASSNPNDIVFDPCCGSGTTCIAAKNLNRCYLGIDIDSECCKVATERLNFV